MLRRNRRSTEERIWSLLLKKQTRSYGCHQIKIMDYILYFSNIYMLFYCVGLPVYNKVPVTSGDAEDSIHFSIYFIFLQYIFLSLLFLCFKVHHCFEFTMSPAVQCGIPKCLKRKSSIYDFDLKPVC